MLLSASVPHVNDNYYAPIDYGSPDLCENEFIFPDRFFYEFDGRFSVADDGSEALFITDRELLDEIVELNQLIPPGEGAELAVLAFIPFDSTDEESLHVEVRGNSNATEIRNIRARPRRANHFASTIRYDSARNMTAHNSPLTITRSGTMTSSFTANASVTNGVVSAGVGFNIGVQRTYTSSFTITVPPNRTGIIRSSVYAHVVDFDIHRVVSGERVGNGSASRADGIRFEGWTQ